MREEEGRGGGVGRNGGDEEGRGEEVGEEERDTGEETRGGFILSFSISVKSAERRKRVPRSPERHVHQSTKHKSLK